MAKRVVFFTFLQIDINCDNPYSSDLHFNISDIQTKLNHFILEKTNESEYSKEQFLIE